MGNTVLLATVCAAKDANPGVDFMPLQVEYKEKYAAFGRFPGGFTRREGKASDYEILTCRLVDRACAPSSQMTTMPKSSSMSFSSLRMV